VRERLHAHRDGHPPLVADVDGRRLIVADMHDREARRRFAGAHARVNLHLDLMRKAIGTRFPVDDASCHAVGILRQRHWGAK
jgi:hypothetical protein